MTPTRPLYVIERRNRDGSLDLKGRQPEDVFGLAAIQGITEDAMAKRVFSRLPDAILMGNAISAWPSQLDSAWIARVKTW